MSQPWNNRPITYLIIILVIAIVLRVVFYTGVNFNDDLVYLNFAHDITQGRFHPHPYIFATRLLMQYPIAFFFLLFGVSEFSATLYMLLASLATIILTYLIGRELFNNQTGLLAALLLAFLPLDIIYSTTITPDVPTAFYLALSVYLFIIGNKKSNKLLQYSSGIAIGLAWLVKNLAIIYVLLFIGYFILELIKKKDRFFRTLKPYLFVASGLISILIIEGIIYSSLGYSFLTVFEVNNEHYTTTLLGVNRDLRYYPAQLFNYDSLGKYFHYIGYYFYFSLLSIALILLKKRKEAYILIIWLLPMTLFLQYGSMSITQYLLIQRIYRFLTIISVPMCLLIAYYIANINFKLDRLIKPSLIIILLVTSLVYTYNAHVYLYKSMADTKLSAEFLSSQEPRNIFADETTIGYYNFFFSYKKEQFLKKLDYVKSIDEMNDSYVVVDANRGYVDLPNLRSRLPSFMSPIPQDWKLLHTVTESDIEAYRSYNTTIYYAP